MAPTPRRRLRSANSLIQSASGTFTNRIKGPNGNYRQRKARTHAYYILDGFVIQEDNRSLDATGNVVFRGTSIRTFDPRKKKWVNKWIKANRSGYTDIEGEYKDGRTTATGKGLDYWGRPFLERYEIYDISVDHASFQMDRSLDGGKTWIEKRSMSERRRSRPAPGTTAVTDGPNPEAPPETSQLAFFIGEWDITAKTKRPDGTYYLNKARSNAYYILDGFAIRDDYRALDAGGNVVFRGAGFRSYDPGKKKWTIMWIMANQPGYTHIEAKMVGGRLTSTGKGYDGSGPFLERYTYYIISEDHYSFKMDRSYNEGKTWIEDFVLLEAGKVR